MKLKNIILLGILSFSVLTSCKQEEVQPFTGETGVNFLGYNPTDSTWHTGTEFLSKEINLFDSINIERFPLNSIDIPMRIAIEGRTSNRDLKVKLKAVAIEGQPEAEVRFPDNIVVKAGENYAEFRLTLLNPGSDIAPKSVRITVDYANSDLVAGVKDRQGFVFTVRDHAVKTYEDRVDEALFVTTFEQHLGTYGPIKHRFAIAATKPSGGASSADFFRLMVAYSALLPSYPQYGLPSALEGYRKALAEYNASHTEPLKEADGTLITFPNP